MLNCVTMLKCLLKSHMKVLCFFLYLGERNREVKGFFALYFHIHEIGKILYVDLVSIDPIIF